MARAGEKGRRGHPLEGQGADQGGPTLPLVELWGEGSSPPLSLRFLGATTPHPSL